MDIYGHDAVDSMLVEGRGGGGGEAEEVDVKTGDSNKDNI